MRRRFHLGARHDQPALQEIAAGVLVLTREPIRGATSRPAPRKYKMSRFNPCALRTRRYACSRLCRALVVSTREPVRLDRHQLCRRLQGRASNREPVRGSTATSGLLVRVAECVSTREPARAQRTSKPSTHSPLRASTREPARAQRQPFLHPKTAPRVSTRELARARR